MKPFVALFILVASMAIGDVGMHSQALLAHGMLPHVAHLAGDGDPPFPH